MSGSGEYISRNAAIEAMYKDAEANPNHTFWTSQFDALMDIPAADVRPVERGVWVKNGWSIRCSICGYDMPFATRNFCPNCGARMEESCADENCRRRKADDSVDFCRP